MHQKNNNEIENMMNQYKENYKKMFGKEPSKKDLQTRFEAAIERKKDELFKSMFYDQTPITLDICLQSVKSK